MWCAGTPISARPHMRYLAPVLITYNQLTPKREPPSAEADPTYNISVQK